MSELYERIKVARKERRLSQEEVAKYLGINRTAVVEMEAGKRKVSSEELKKLCGLFGKSADELLFGNSVSDMDMLLLRNFAALDANDQNEILGLVEFKRIRKEGRLPAYMERKEPEEE